MIRIASVSRKLLLSTALGAGNPLMFAIGSAATAALFTAAPAYADECSSGTPPVPPPTGDLSGSFGGGQPAYGVLVGSDGCSGKSASTTGSGNVGGAGQATGNITLVITGGTTAPSSGPAVNLTAVGGAGRAGSGDGDLGVNTTAGSGGAGGGNGNITSNVESGAVLSANGTVINVQSTGGEGGTGATGYNNGSGGAGGSGGNIPNFTLAAGSTVTDTGSGPAVLVLSQGGDGGHQNGSTRTFVNDGKSAGAAGSAGTITTEIDGSVTANQGNGINIQGNGGNGGTGDDVISVTGEATGTTGGNGGNGSPTILFGMTGSVQAAQTGVSVVANGGDAGAGAYAGAGADGHGGRGGTGGIGGTIAGSASGAVTAEDGFNLVANGGAGGAGGTSNGGATTTGGKGGDGGVGGSIVGDSSTGFAFATTVNATQTGIVIAANGGSGGGGGKAGATTSQAGAGGVGGVGGANIVSLNGSITALTIGLGVSANGGDGGAGGGAFSITATNGGSGGTGGAGGGPTNNGGALLFFNSGGSVTTTGADSPTASTVVPGVLVEANGGAGGGTGNTDGITGTAGGGGVGGAGGTASANIAGNISTTGALAYGVLAQAVAGFGGASGHTGDVWSTGGSDGGAGGDGGTATVTTTGGVVQTSGTGAIGIVAQSVGGGGGAGGNASAGGGNTAMGGTGGTGGVGQAATLTLANTTITRGEQAIGAVALSVGGGGGNGGNAYDNGAEVSITIGGDGNTGGNGGSATVTNGGLVTTFASHASGIQAESVGGGGGNGGSAISKSDGVTLSVSVAVGGTGGDGGNSGQVTLTNNQQVTTYGADSFGLKAQEIAGGGGNGGSSMATATATAGGNQNAISMSASIGGSGGGGGDGTASPVQLTNNGFVATGGDGGVGLLAQNLAGGGGTGGESSAAAYSDGTTTSNTTSITLGMGGKGGVGGTAGTANATNNALVFTLGESAYGLFAQSAGGGGGQGSGGDSTAKNTPSNLSGKFTVTLGGNGGGGGTGGNAIGDNAGGIATAGDGARGMLVESIGGGGGAAGGAVGKANGGGGLTINVTLGGTGGTGGTGGEADGYNHLGIVTNGADADGMFVQSVGGGGGTGGKAASTNGGAADPSDLNHQLQTAFANGLGVGESATLVDGTSDVYQVGNGQLTSVNGIAQLQKVINSAKTVSLSDDADDDGNTTGSLTLNLKMGNDGGTGGDGEKAYAFNEGAISTTGAKSDGIFVQSVGGGGGAGGAVSFTDSSSPSASIIMGGSGGAGGNGGAAQLDNATEAEVFTKGVTSMALVAQSVGGGGGKGGVTASTGGGLKNLTVTLGGTGGTAGTGGDVTVNNDVGSYLSTSGKNSIGIVAQSVGGGGGITSVLSKDQTGAGGDSGSDSGSVDLFGYTLSLGDTSTAAGSSDGGTVTINDPQSLLSAGIGYIKTSGRDAYGILAQSIGGGGGLVVGGNPTGTSFFGSGTMVGNGNTVTVEVGNAISTTGQGGVGIMAQSIGGGGILAGDTGWTQQRQAFSESGTHTGNGGDITVTVDQGGSITTSAPNSPGIWAQSIGGGGGLVNTTAGPAYAGSAGGTGTGGKINIIVNGDITVTGLASNGVLAQSLGDSTSTSPITVTVGATGNIQAGTGSQEAFGDGTSAGVYIDHGGLTSATPNVVTNNGTLFTYSAVTNSVAVWSTGGYTEVYNNGTMGGDILLTNGGGQGCFTNNGHFVSGDTVAVGLCGVTNFGTIQIQGTKTGTTTITGNYSGTGKIVFDADFVGGTSDKLVINGKANIAGQIEVDPTTIRNAKLALVSATGGVTIDPRLSAIQNANGLFTYNFTSDGTTLYATPQAQFAQAASALGNPQQSVAGHLQSLFDSGELFDTGFTALSNLATPTDYANTLESLTGKALGAMAAERYQASRRFVSDVNGACDTASDSTCTWARVQAGHTTQDETVDALGYDAQFEIYEMGVQTRIADGLYIGGALAYEHSKLRDEDRTARIHGDSMLGAIGLHYRSGAFELVGSIDGGYGWYTSNRQITVGSDTVTALAKPRLWNIGMDLTASYLVPLGKASYLKPFAEVRGTNVHSNAFSEVSTSVFALDVLAQSDFAVSGTIGAALGTSIDAGDGVTRLKPFVTAAVEFSGDTDWKTSARFVGESGTTAPFTVQTRSPGTFGRFGIGADLASGANFDLVLSYNPEVGSHYTTQQGVARITYRF